MLELHYPMIQFLITTNRIRFCFFQSKCVVMMSSPREGEDQQPGESCSMSFVRFVFLILGTIVFNTVLERFLLCIFGEFCRSLKYVRNFPRSTDMFICWRARKPGRRSQIKSSKKDNSI